MKRTFYCCDRHSGISLSVFMITTVLLLTSKGGTCALASKEIFESNHKGMRTRQAAVQLGVQPSWNLPGWVRRFVFKLEKRIIPILFSIFSSESILPNSHLSLCVLWWKAVAASRSPSPLHDPDRCWTDLMLPPTFLRTLTRLYPRLSSVVTIEVRSTFIDRSIIQCIQEVRRSSPNIRIRLIIMGAGYDTRAIRLLNQQFVDEAYELDLDTVIQAKSSLLESQRLSHSSINKLPKFRAVDLNQIEQAESVLRDIILMQNDTLHDWHTIFVFEAVLMYLEPGKASRLLSICQQSLPSDLDDDADDYSCYGSGSLVFADRLDDISNDANFSGAFSELQRRGWWLQQWLLKDGGTKHMGWATSRMPTEKVLLEQVQILVT